MKKIMCFLFNHKYTEKLRYIEDLEVIVVTHLQCSRCGKLDWKSVERGFEMARNHRENWLKLRMKDLEE